MKLVRLTMISAFAPVVVFLAITLIVPTMKWTNDSNVRSLEELRDKCQNCEKAKHLAHQDFKNNKFRTVFWGLPDDPSATAELVPLLAKRFNIQVLWGGCITNPNMECYNQQMKELLLTKFSEDELNRAYLEAKQRYELKKGSQY